MGLDPGSPGSRPGLKAVLNCWATSAPCNCVAFLKNFISRQFNNYYLYSLSEWDHIMFVLLRLTYFTQHQTLQFRPRRSKWWVFVVSNGWGIFHCIHRPQLLYPSSFDGHRGSFHSLAIVDIAARNIRVQVSRHLYHCICIFGVNPQQCNCWVVGQVYF